MWGYKAMMAGVTLALSAAPAVSQPMPGGPAPAESPPSAPAPPPATANATPAAGDTAPSPACCHVEVGTVVDIELVDHVSTKIQKAGDTFALRLAEPLVVDGSVVLRAGAPGVGEVIDSAPPGMGGKGAKLVLAARYVEQDGVRVRLRSFKLGASGHAYAKTAEVVSLVGAEVFPPLAFVGLAVTGGNVDYPPGTRANAKVAEDLTLPPTSSGPLSLETPPPAPSAVPSTPPDKGTTP